MEALKDLINEVFNKTTVSCEIRHGKCDKSGEFYVTSYCKVCGLTECVLVCETAAKEVMDTCVDGGTVKCHTCHTFMDISEMVRSVDRRGNTL